MHALIVCGGTPPTKKLLETEISKADLIIGADSGGHAIIGHGFTPDIVIGDLDSFHYTNHEGINVQKDPDQGSTDLDKALCYALEQEARTCSVLGAFGKRIDHQQKNLSSLVEFHPRFEKLVYWDSYGETFMVESPYITELPIGTIISFFTLSGLVTGFTSTGVLYPLTDKILEPGVQDGTSNTVTDGKVKVEFTSGKLGVFIGRGDKL